MYMSAALAIVINKYTLQVVQEKINIKKEEKCTHLKGSAFVVFASFLVHCAINPPGLRGGIINTHTTTAGRGLCTLYVYIAYICVHALCAPASVFIYYTKRHLQYACITIIILLLMRRAALA